MKATNLHVRQTARDHLEVMFDGEESAPGMGVVETHGHLYDVFVASGHMVVCAATSRRPLAVVHGEQELMGWLAEKHHGTRVQA